MKRLRFVLGALVFCLVATAAFAMRARATSSPMSCTPWELCFCLEIDCSHGDQLCATGPGFTCYQWGLNGQ